MRRESLFFGILTLVASVFLTGCSDDDTEVYVPQRVAEFNLSDELDGNRLFIIHPWEGEIAIPVHDDRIRDFEFSGKYFDWEMRQGAESRFLVLNLKKEVELKPFLEKVALRGIASKSGEAATDTLFLVSQPKLESSVADDAPSYMHNVGKTVNASGDIFAAPNGQLVFDAMKMADKGHGVLLLTLVLMVYRFYKNLMTDEGYLMFTLPVSRSQLIWSKLIVSMAWGILSAVLAALMWTMVLSVAGGENLFAGIFRGLRSLMESLSGNATGCIVGLVVLLLAAELASYLRFYAAISLGHSFSNHKLLLSVVFYIGFGIAVQTILSVVTAAGIRIDVDPDFWADPPAAVLLSYVIWGTAAWSVLECAAYYILTLLTLKKRLNLQ